MAPPGVAEYCCLAEKGLERGISVSCKLEAPAQAAPNGGKRPPTVGPARRTTPRPGGAEGLQRAASDGAALSCEISRMAGDNKDNDNSNNSEVEQARCECCGLCEEYTPAYIGRVKGLFCGRWICGLCAEAVKEERHRMGRGTPVEDALQAHVTVCIKFNQVARANPAVRLADAMRQILKKSAEGSHPHGLRSKSCIGPRLGHVSKASLARSSSCIPAITKD